MMFPSKISMNRSKGVSLTCKTGNIVYNNSMKFTAVCPA